jgi:hypothetical protein
MQYICTTRTILLNPIALFCFCLQLEWLTIYTSCQLSSSFDGFLAGLSSQASGKRRTVTIAQEVKRPVAIDLNLSAEDSNS